MSKRKYTLEEKTQCAQLCDLQVSTVSKLVSTHSLDASDPETFRKQYAALVQKKETVKDPELEQAKKDRIIEQAKKEKVLREKAEFDLAVSKGEYISIEDHKALYSHLGLMTKTLGEAMPGPLGIKGEGKSAKEITKIAEAAVAEMLHQLSTLG